MKAETISRLKKRPLVKDLIRDRAFYYLIIPGVLYFLIFHYVPIVGIATAFMDLNKYDISLSGILTSPWVGLKHFNRFFSSFYFWSLLRNTMLISIYSLVAGFPMPILFALLINEVRNLRYKRIVQGISYFPYFLSSVVVVGLVRIFFTSDPSGTMNRIIALFGQEPLYWLGARRFFRSIYVGTQIWQQVGWGAIIYLAAITGINPELYESAHIDGANRLQQVVHITMPSILHIAVLLLVLRLGGMLTVDFQYILLLYSPQVYEVADVIQTYVYREGLEYLNYSYSAAVGLFNSVVSVILIVTANRIAKQLGQEALW